jgi:hypothetical protein
MRRNPPTSEFTSLKESPSFSLILCVIDILLLNFTDSTSLGLPSLKKRGRGNLFPYHSTSLTFQLEA